MFDCGQCEGSFARSDNLEKHKRTCTGGQVTVPVVDPAAKKRRIGVAPEFKLRKTRQSLGGAVERFTVNMKEARYLSALKKAIAVFTPVMTKFHQEDRAYKFPIAVNIVFHNAVDTAVVTQPPGGTGIGNGCSIFRCVSTSRRCKPPNVKLEKCMDQVGYFRILLLSS